MNRRARWLRGIALSLMLAVLACAAITARAVGDGEAELRRSDAAFNRGELTAALEHARRAAIDYAPGAPHVARAYARLIAIAVGAEAQGKPHLALAAWRAVRGAELETRHLWIPHRRELERANRSLARLEATPPPPPDARQITGPLTPSAATSAGAPSPDASGAAARATAADAQAEHAVEQRLLGELQREQSPDAYWVLALGIGFAAAALGLALVAWRGVSPEGRLTLFHAKLGLVLTALGAACWTIAVLWA
jgi:hypothetical protein